MSTTLTARPPNRSSDLKHEYADNIQELFGEISGRTSGSRRAIQYEAVSEPVRTNLTPYNNVRAFFMCRSIRRGLLPIDVTVTLSRGDDPTMEVRGMFLVTKNGVVRAARISAQERQPVIKNDQELPTEIAGRPIIKKQLTARSPLARTLGKAAAKLAFNAYAGKGNLTTIMTSLLNHSDPAIRFDAAAFAQGVMTAVNYPTPLSRRHT